MHGMYWGGNPTSELSYLPFWNVQKHICSNNGVPYIALIHRSGENRAAFGSFDQLTETSLTAHLSEADRSYHFRLIKPDYTGQTLCVNRRREEIFFVSISHQPWSDVLQNYVCLCDAENQPVRLPVPAHAFDPVFCTWTAIHHDVSHEWIMHNARIAADLGFRTWITADGWFTDQGKFADYRHTGDWQPFMPKFPDMKAHVNAVQALGFHYILWLSVLLEATERARAYEPELLVEFRNPYANLASRSYSNIYRCSDVPLNYTLNRWQAVMLRLLTPDRAIHLDPALWHADETDENVAVHLINVIVSVPMLSVELDRYPQSHLDLIRYWISFYNAHRNTIVHGEFKPTLALGHVPQIAFTSEGESIIGLYEDVPVELNNAPSFWILNASSRPFVDFQPFASSGERRVVTRDKFGSVTCEQIVAFPIERLPLEVGGSLEIRIVE
jgi:hypothetical protein